MISYYGRKIELSRIMREGKINLLKAEMTNSMFTLKASAMFPFFHNMLRL